jgi:uracil-DNA glycosylase
MSYTDGSINSNIMLVLDGLDTSEFRRGKPFAGIYQNLIQWLLVQGNLRRNALFINPIFYQEIKRSKDGKTIMDTRGVWLWKHKEGYNPARQDDAKRTFEYYKNQWFDKHRTDCCVIAMGELALQELTGYKGIHKYRGSPLIRDGIFFIPTLQPYQVSERGQYLLRYAVGSDLRKARRYASGYEPTQRELILPTV